MLTFAVTERNINMFVITCISKSRLFSSS